MNTIKKYFVAFIEALVEARRMQAKAVQHRYRHLK